jgi:N utilization substance protein B
MSQSYRTARVLAMQLLYAMKLTRLTLPQVMEGVFASLQPDESQKKYGIQLVDAVQEKIQEIDSEISELSESWDIERLAMLDKIILSVAIAELWTVPEVPVRVVLKESAAIGRKYSTSESGSFINGIMDAFARKAGYIKTE